ncbi:hypothetical protein ARALYDRAFT_899826 [Arabidopsis lyrata subsp. lyrata]|uniref:Uncharacterized protein n=1 Tax=Arabidopsis lyrata subsp. lyrata TaxID=81972 RepID=D7L589_ARALL|nr:hypothetical protein ARALYDRAFT_899826 [Arabidopsis lyrata subsp. lyrata]
MMSFFKVCKFFTSRNSGKISPATISKLSEERLWKEFQEEDHILKAHVRSSIPSPELSGGNRTGSNA